MVSCFLFFLECSQLWTPLQLFCKQIINFSLYWIICTAASGRAQLYFNPSINRGELTFSNFQAQAPRRFRQIKYTPISITIVSRGSLWFLGVFWKSGCVSFGRSTSTRPNGGQQAKSGRSAASGWFATLFSASGFGAWCYDDHIFKVF
jgi:hypothetical protein